MKDYMATLNAEQKAAVTHGEGPLLIIAGAGTGKTRVLTHRMIHLIETGKARPDEILAITFTEKASLEITERLDVLLPMGYQELWVKTFHGFCDAVLREKGLEIGLDTAYQLMTQTELILFLKEQLFSFDLKYYRPLGNPLRFIHSLASHFGHLRDEVVTPPTYIHYAESMVKGAKDAEEVELAEKTLELAHAYAHYDKLLPKSGRLDFANLTYLALDLLERRPSVLSEYQRRFKYIVVDEFQDTNTSQNRLVELLAMNSKNIMVVGDDDQSIYKWRGASLANILNFEKRFPSTKRVVLTQNFRSTQPILDMSHGVIKHNNPHRLEEQACIDKRLISQVDNSDSKKPHVIHFESIFQEAQFVAEKIIRHVADTPGVNYRDCAVLVRATAHAYPFIDEFVRRGLPYHFSGSQGLYMRPEIKDLLSVLRVLVNPYDDIALFRVLSFSVFGFESEYLLSLLHKTKSTSTPLLKALRARAEAPDLFSVLGMGSKMDSFLELFDELRLMVKTHPTSHILGAFIKKSSYLSSFDEIGDSESAESLQNIATLSQIIKEFETSHADHRLPECLESLKSRQDMGDRPSPPDESLDSDTIKVLTVHASKGLEFDTVFVVNLVQHRFPTINRRDPFAVPEELLAEALDHDSAHIHEERRLFYVASTRAKRHLFLTYSDYYGGKKRWKPSQFVLEAQSSEFVDVTEDGGALLNPARVAVVATDSDEEKPVIFSYERSHRSLRLSFSRISTFKMCPLKYKFRYVYQLAEPLSHAASFGSSVHNALNAFYGELKTGGIPTLERLWALYQKHWIPMGYTNTAHHDARKLEGWDMLKKFFESNSASWVMPSYLERPFTLKLKDLAVSGRIDRIDRLPDGSYEVIDYKTGKMLDQKAVDKDLQLSIYALACRDVYKIPVSSLSLYYLGDNKKITTHRSDEQLSTTSLELSEISSTIGDSTFEAKPSAYICGFCDYNLVCEKSAS
jgi:DNA helicase II / ATP-dependent DNA helicase PcrA